MEHAVGIDLGTTFSAIAVVDRAGKPVVLRNAEGATVTPSVVFFEGDEPIVGDAAKEMQGLGESEVAFLFKRSMGDPFFVLEFGGQSYTPVDLSALVLRKLVRDAEAALGGTVSSAVITVPAYFDDHQRRATIAAGEKAGLKVLRIINEPTAAALAYGLDAHTGDQSILVYDLGGGTFDVTVVRISGSAITVLGTAGDHELGGKDWDDRIAQWLDTQFQELHEASPLGDCESANDLLVRCENAKKQLSSRDTTSISMAHDGLRERFDLTREQFDELTRDLMERTQRLCDQTLTDIGLAWSDLDGVLLVGGSTRMPMVRHYVTEMSGKPPRDGVNVDEAVAIGAALQAAAESTPTPGWTLPGAKTVTDVMSHSLGMVAVNKDTTAYINSIIIPKNNPVPCQEMRPFQLRVRKHGDNQAEVYMLQGESSDPTQAAVLGKYIFSGLEPVAGGTSVLDIQYAYDANGVVTVSAKQRETGRDLQLQVEPVPGDMSWLARPPEEVKEAHTHLTVLIAIDLSGSMSGKPLQEAQKAAKKFVSQLDLSHTSVGLIGFANRVEVATEPSQSARDLAKAIDGWSGWMRSGVLGWGNLAQPFTQANQILADYEDPRFLIVLTDGVWVNQAKAIQCAKTLSQTGVDIIALGFGGADRQFLKAIATSDENALLTDLSKLTHSFSKIAQVLTESGSNTRGQGGLLRFFG